ncbi:MAG: hypothetical protein ACRYFZ_21345 [Janthinobacterium lividum]
MKTAQKSADTKVPFVTIDPALNEYQDKILFPEKLALANKQLKGVKLPPKRPRS